MVVPSKNPPKIGVQSYARPSAKVTPASARTNSDRRASDIWVAASEPIARDFLQLARTHAAGMWYDVLTSDEVRHWFTYFNDDVTQDGFSVRRIPRQVTEELAIANERDCFTDYVIRTNRQCRQYVLLGTLGEGASIKYYPVVAWYPSETQVPAPQMLEEYYEAETAKSRQERENAEERARRAAEAAQEQRREARRLRRIYWWVAASSLGAINLTLLTVFSMQWVFCSLPVTLIGAWVVFDVNNGYVYTVAFVRRRLATSLVALNLVVGSLLGAAALL